MVQRIFRVGEGGRTERERVSGRGELLVLAVGWMNDIVEDAPSGILSMSEVVHVPTGPAGFRVPKVSILWTLYRSLDRDRMRCRA